MPSPTASAESGARPDVVVFDVNETLSDLSPMDATFAELGAPPGLAGAWFAGVLRDGFALTAVGESASFADIAAAVLRGLWTGVDAETSADEAVERVMAAFTQLPVHPDVPDGIRALTASGVRVVTLSVGSASVAAELLGRAGVGDEVERYLSAEQAGAWKPAGQAYRYAADQCDVDVRQLMLVAAHPWDIHGASRCGLSTAWVNRGARPYPAHFAKPSLTVTALAELAGRLRADGATGSRGD